MLFSQNSEDISESKADLSERRHYPIFFYISINYE